MYRTAFILFIATLIFAPLAFGTTEQWSMATVQLLVCCSAFCLVFSLKNKEARLLTPPGMLPLVLLVLWMFFQFLPLPAAIVRIVTPAIYGIYKPICEVYGQSQDLWIPLTVNQKATLFECMRIASYALFYFLTVQILSNGTRLKNTVKIVAYLSISIAFLAIIQKFSSPDKIYWFRSAPEHADIFGPWVYHNHYAGFMEMMCPLVFALFLFYRPTVDHEKSLRSRLAAAFTLPGSNLHIFFGFGAIIIVSSIFLSLSRGGIISLTLALALFLVILAKEHIKFKFVTYGFIVICVVLMITWFGWGPVVDKFGTTFTATGRIENVRLILWKDSLQIIRDFWTTGTGFGTFIHIYPLYTTLSSNFIFDHAHNDYIELLTDGGIVGFALAAWFVLTIIIHGWKKIQLRRDRYAILISVGALTGIVAILLHSVTDFNMHNGANGLYFFFLCGLLVSAGNTRLYYRTMPTLLDKAGSNTKIILFAATLLLAGATIFVQGGALFADAVYSKVANIYLNKNLSEEKLLTVASTARRAARYDPLEGKYSFALGSTQIFLNQPKKALASFIQAAEKDPLSGIYLQRLALMLTTVDKSAAEKLMPIAYARALNKDSLILTWAEWLLSMNEREKAILMLQQVFASKPQLVKKIMPAIMGYSFNRREITIMLPDSVGAWVYYGHLVEQQGNMKDAEFYRTRALDFLDREKVIKPWYFSQLYWFYYRREKYDQALIVLRKAIERLPEHAQFHVYLGDYYMKEGIFYRAKEEYDQALLLEPADEKTRKKLEKLQNIRDGNG
ncbi:O-Antigen ligase [bacterium BMS3Bbin14]|nr:O-Antigen ligase [bacterium BMS3Bbin14]